MIKQILISSDSIGFLGSSSQFLFLWKDLFEKKYFHGVELIAFKPIDKLQNFVLTLEKNNIKVLSFHGKTGGEDRLSLIGRLTMSFVNKFILGVDELANIFSNYEFLFHTPYLEDIKIKNYILKNKNKIKTLWIENHLDGIEGLKETIKIVDFYRQNGVNALGLIDLYHVVSKIKTKYLIENWENIIDEIAKYKKYFIGVHFPIGTRLDDSLPIDLLTDEQLIYLDKKILKFVNKIVFENQQKNLGLLYSNYLMLKKQKLRNERIFNRLKKLDII
ncbi:MAG: hypothetical protein Fur009_8130 [Candidatus Microgenomates bacterium]